MTVPVGLAAKLVGSLVCLNPDGHALLLMPCLGETLAEMQDVSRHLVL